MADNHFSSTIETLFKGLDQFVTTKTVVGEPVKAGALIYKSGNLPDVGTGIAFQITSN